MRPEPFDDEDHMRVGVGMVEYKRRATSSLNMQAGWKNFTLKGSCANVHGPDENQEHFDGR